MASIREGFFLVVRIMLLQILISGFCQHRGYQHGWYKLREKLLDSGFSLGVERRVWLEPWTVNATRLADSIAILNETCEELFIGVYGYSYGGGQGAITLLNELEEKRIDVQKVVLADPVFRRRWLPKPLPSPVSLLPYHWQPKIKLPANVIDLIHFYQRRNIPHSPFLETHWLTGKVEHRRVDAIHQKIDDHPEVHAAVERCANELESMYLRSRELSFSDSRSLKILNGLQEDRSKAS